MKKILYFLTITFLLSLILASCERDPMLEESDQPTNSEKMKAYQPQSPTPRRPFMVSGTKIYDTYGGSFIMRGINFPFSWFEEEMLNGMEGVASTGANVVRIVLEKDETAAQVGEILDRCFYHKMAAIVEYHGVTGSDDVAKLNEAVDYWISIKSALIGREDLVIINIANEWFGTWSTNTWKTAYMDAVKRMRDNDFDHMLIVDCAGYGQYPQSLFTAGTDVLNADPMKNVVFAIHMYESAGKDSATTTSNINKALDKGLAICISEFGWKHKSANDNIDERYIMKYCQEKRIGWLAWSWKGNTKKTDPREDLSYLDLSNDWEGTDLTDWGDSVVNGTYGIKATARRLSNFITIEVPFTYWRMKDNALQIQMTMQDEYAVYGKSQLRINDRVAIFNSDGTEYASVGSGAVNSPFPNDMDLWEYANIGNAARVKNIINCLETGVTIREPYVYGDVISLYNIDGTTKLPFEGYFLEYLHQTHSDVGSYNICLEDNAAIGTNPFQPVRYNAANNNPEPIDFLPSYWGEVNIGSRNIIVFQGGLYHCENFIIDTDVELIFPADERVEIWVRNKVEIKSRTKMLSIVDGDKVGANPANILLVSGGNYFQGQNVYIAPNVNWRGTLVAPNADVNIDSSTGSQSGGELRTESNPLSYQELSPNGELYGSIYGRLVTIHQNSIVYHVPYAHWNEDLD